MGKPKPHHEIDISGANEGIKENKKSRAGENSREKREEKEGRKRKRANIVVTYTARTMVLDGKHIVRQALGVLGKYRKEG